MASEGMCKKPPQLISNNEYASSWGCIVLMKQKASFVSASFNESRYEIQGFLHTLFLENEAQTSEKKTKTVYIE